MDTRSGLSEITVKKIENGYVLVWEVEPYSRYEFYCCTLEDVATKLEDLLP